MSLEEEKKPKFQQEQLMEVACLAGFVETDQMREIRHQLVAVNNKEEEFLVKLNEYCELAEKEVDKMKDDAERLARALVGLSIIQAAIYLENGRTGDFLEALDHAKQHAFERYYDDLVRYLDQDQ